MKFLEVYSFIEILAGRLELSKRREVVHSLTKILKLKCLREAFEF